MVESDLVQLSLSSVISLPNRFLLCYTFNPIHPSVYTDSSGIVRIYRLEINDNQGDFQFVVLCSPEYTSPAVVILHVYPPPREKCAYLQHLRTARVDGKASVYRGAKDGFYYHDQYWSVSEYLRALSSEGTAALWLRTWVNCYVMNWQDRPNLAALIISATRLCWLS